MPATPGRNDPCHCGSGKKYKQCHLAADEAEARQVREKRRRGRAGSAARRTLRRPRAVLPRDKTHQPWKKTATNTQGFGKTSLPREGRRKLGVSGRRVARRSSPRLGLGCASAKTLPRAAGRRSTEVPAARPSRPKHRPPRSRCASSASTSPTRSRSIARSRCCAAREALQGADLVALQEMDAPGTRADREGARDERRLLPERRPP